MFQAQDSRFEYTDCFHGIYPMHWCQREKPIKFNAQKLLITPKGDAPFLLHQYNRYQKVINNLVEKCDLEPFAQV